MRVLFPLARMLAVGGLLLAGCVNPASRAREHPAGLRSLSSADRQLALGGQVREGFGKDAVYIAWGPPDRTETVRLNGQEYEQWFYIHTEQGVAGGYYGVPRGFAYPAGTGRHGFPRTGYYGSMDTFYPAPVFLRGFPPPETEVPYRKAVFARDVVIGYEPR